MQDDAHAWRSRAVRASREGRTQDAIAASERLVQLCPADGDGWYRLAYQRQQAGQHEAALEAYDRALANDVAEPDEVQLNRAVVLGDALGRWPQALDAMRQALALRPDRVANWLGLAQVHERLGDRDAARASYLALLARQPGNVQAVARLLALPGADQATLELAAGLFGSPALSPADRADLGFSLTLALDARGRSREAFETAHAANAASRRAAGGIRYDRAGQERLADQLIEWSERHAGLLASGSADDAIGGPRPAFICGLFRSGSTLVERMVAAHPGVTAGGELGWLPQLAGDALRRHGGRLDALTPDLLASLRDVYLGRLRQRFAAAGLVTDKRPDNSWLLGLANVLFPQAPVLHTQRDPRDNALALYFLHLSPSMPYALDMADIVHWMQQSARLLRTWRKLLAARLHTVDYDLLVRAPERELGSALAALGLAWDPACLAFHQREGAVATASAWQVREPLYTRSSGRWRRYAAELAPWLDELQALQA